LVGAVPVAGRVSVVPDLVRPAGELEVVGDPALERDRAVLGLAGRLAPAARVAALAVGDDLGLPGQRADPADAGDVRVVPHDPELEVLVRVETGRVDLELSWLWHVVSLVLKLYAALCPAICWSEMMTNSAGLSGANPTWILTIPRSTSYCVV